MKVLKRNIVVITVLLFVCVAVYLNWSYGEESTVSAPDDILSETDLPSGPADDGIQSSDASSAGLYYEESSAETLSEYFDSVRLSRASARSSATETLQTITETAGTSQEMIDSSLAEIAQIAEWSLREAELESLIMAKGFADCVVYISEGGINVTVPAGSEGLSSVSVAKITDIITGETDFGTDSLKIIEIK